IPEAAEHEGRQGSERHREIIDVRHIPSPSSSFQRKLDSHFSQGTEIPAFAGMTHPLTLSRVHFLARLAHYPLELVAEHGDVPVEITNVAIGARLHDRALHHRQ